MNRALNQRILKTIRELADDEDITDFLIRILQEESIHMSDNKKYWHFQEFYKQEITRTNESLIKKTDDD